MPRQWEKFTFDELKLIWNSYKHMDYEGYDVLRTETDFKEAIRLTPVEIAKLTDELLIRLGKCQESHPLDLPEDNPDNPYEN